MSKISTSTYKTDKRYPGVRRRYIGFVYGFGEDWIFSLNCRDKSQGNKIRNDILGKASEGWTMQKAFLEKERLLALNIEDEIIDNDYSSVTLKDVFQDYSVYYAQERRKCIIDYTNYSKKISFFNTKPIAMIKNRDIQDLRKKLEREISCRGKPYSAKTINEILSLVSLLINHGVKRELCNARPDLVIEKPSINNQVTEFLDDKQLTAYKQALETDKDIIGAAFLKIALYTGMRSKAIKNLKWEDIDFQTNIIKLRAEVAKNNTDSYIPLSSTVKKILEEIPRRNGAIYIFEQKNGSPRNTFAKTAARIRDRAGLPKNFRPVYMLRHNFATQLASSGQVELYTIQKLMTHKSPQMTQRYAHLMDKTVQDASKVLEKIINQEE